jgi:hypothetical protein
VEGGRRLRILLAIQTWPETADAVTHTEGIARRNQIGKLVKFVVCSATGRGGTLDNGWYARSS